MSPTDLIQDYLDNELSEASREAFRRWLDEDAAHLDQLVVEALLDSQLRSVLGESKVRRDLLSLACAEDAAGLPESAGVSAPGVTLSGTSRRGSAADARPYVPPIAAIIAVVASLAACIAVVVGTNARRPGAGPVARQLAAQPKAQSQSAAPRSQAKARWRN